jgi:hypothetical protein
MLAEAAAINAIALSTHASASKGTDAACMIATLTNVALAIAVNV